MVAPSFSRLNPDISRNFASSCRGRAFFQSKIKSKIRGRNVSILVLVVDDEADIHALFRNEFRRDVRSDRFLMEFATSAADALARIATPIEQTLILILSDIN